MCSGTTNSSSILSSENDTQYNNREILNEKPFVTSYDFSSDEIINCGMEVDPFDDTSCKFNKQKEHNWILYKNSNLKKAISLPLISRKFLKDFYRDSSNGEVFSLPTLGIGRSDSIQRISADVLNDLINKKYNIEYSIIDCRL